MPDRCMKFLPSGAHLTWVSADESGYVSVESIVNALTPSTRLVAMTHCSNVTGALNSAAEIGAVLKQRGVTFLLDASQSAGSVPVDIPALHVDLFAAPGHKGMYGPQGTGFLYLAEDVRLKPLMVGGTGGSSTELAPSEALPERYESGTHNIAGIAGLKAGVDFIAAMGVDNIHAQEMRLVTRLIEGLAAINGVRVINRDLARPRGAVVSFTLDGVDPSVIGFSLDRPLMEYTSMNGVLPCRRAALSDLYRRRQVLR